MNRVDTFVVAGTDPHGRGGIASVLGPLLGQLQRDDALAGFLCTHRSAPVARVAPALRASLALPGLLRQTRRSGRQPALWLHVGGPVSVVRTLPLALSARALGVPVLTTLHSLATVDALDHRAAPALHALLAASDQLTAPSHTLVAAYRQRGLERVAHLPNPLPVAAHSALDEPVRTSRRRRSLRLLSATRLVEGKGLTALLDAMVQLPEDELVVAGAGPLLPELLEQRAHLGLGERVRFVGWQEDLAPLYREADVFLLPSERDTFGMAVVEAMAHGLPVIVADTPLSAEVVGAGGLRVRPTGDALAAAVESLRPQRRKAAHAAREAALHHRVEDLSTRALNRIRSRRGDDAGLR